MALELPRDFSDRLSPMLVKELRQGLRTRVFASAFLLLQALMIFSMFVASTQPQATELLDSFYWSFLGITLLFIMPLRGINALLKEQKQNTLELVYVTQLTAFRIVAGKWAAIFAQSLLLTVAVLPYLVLRYFFGGVNLLGDLVALGFMLLASATFTAFTVGFSAFRSMLLRAIFFVGLIMVGFGGINGLLGVMFYSAAMGSLGGPGGGPMSSASGLFFSGGAYWIGLLAFFLIGAFFTYYFLAMGASRIASASENYATRKRILSLVAVALALASPLFGLSEGIAIIVTIIIAVPVVIDALTERATVSRIVMRNFVQSRFLPSGTSYFLAPGWHTGVFYFFVMSLVFLGGFNYYFAETMDEAWLHYLVLGLSVLVFPMLVIHLIVRSTENTFNHYVVIQAIATLVTAILAIPASAFGSEFMLWILFVVPHTAFIIVLQENDSGAFLSLFHAALIVATVIISYAAGRPHYQKMAAFIREEKIRRSGAPDPGNAEPAA